MRRVRTILPRAVMGGLGSLESEPLGLDAAILILVGADGLLPAAPDAVEAFGVDVVCLDEQAADLVGALPAEINGFERHLAHEGFAAAFAELLDHRAVDV